ncbi:MAG: AAA family ATPase, partial [Hyphomicrobiaceae bacterium]|nr:AAA family ATPase [Hyphomicrobiaceae bacterium]
EIEKAHPDLFNILLQIMDHGTLTDSNGKKVDFRNVVLIMTTNAGASDMSKPAIGFKSSRREGDDMEAINRLFTPEFRNRLDATIQFGHLPPEVVHRVVEKFVLQLEAQLADRNVTIELSPEATEWLSQEGYDELMGARPLGRVIQEHIKKPLADEVLFGRLVKGGTVRVIVEQPESGPSRLSLNVLEEPVAPRPDPVPAKKAKAAKAAKASSSTTPAARKRKPSAGRGKAEPKPSPDAAGEGSKAVKRKRPTVPSVPKGGE